VCPLTLGSARSLLSLLLTAADHTGASYPDRLLGASIMLNQRQSFRQNCNAYTLVGDSDCEVDQQTGKLNTGERACCLVCLSRWWLHTALCVDMDVTRELLRSGAPNTLLLFVNTELLHSTLVQQCMINSSTCKHSSVESTLHQCLTVLLTH